MSESPTVTFGKMLRSYRRTYHMSQSELGKLVGAHRNTLVRYECGLTAPDLDIAARIAQVFNIRLSEFLKMGGY